MDWPRLWTMNRLSTLTGLTLVIWGLLLSLGATWARHTPDARGFHSGTFAASTHPSGAALTSATPGGGVVEAAPSDLIETDEEEESSWSVAPLVTPAFLSSVWPRQAAPDAQPVARLTRIVAIPLRC